MNKFYNKFKNIKKIINNNYIIISYNLNNVKKTLLNLILKKTHFRITYLNSKELYFFNLSEYNNLYFLFIKNDTLLIKNILINILNFLEKKPIFLFSNNCFIKKIPIKEFSNLSKENLISEFINFLKLKFFRLIKLLKQI
ncbi:hypothetical protein CUN91_00375 [Candidatus Carsonella ruddii]|uniref:Ribosomal protein L10 n=1 Tax=Carsonella ruddii TaxID=114186 RepID=A0A2K8K475_CARRU|nr:hypothetical protein [Candidatus Carsonella ruddii]ATX33412.1 hypothetical protein CUN91_00375 [Candidatus Carsonella ruddii]